MDRRTGPPHTDRPQRPQPGRRTHNVHTTRHVLNLHLPLANAGMAYRQTVCKVTPPRLRWTRRAPPRLRSVCEPWILPDQRTPRKSRHLQADFPRVLQAASRTRRAQRARFSGSTLRWERRNSKLAYLKGVCQPKRARRNRRGKKSCTGRPRPRPRVVSAPALQCPIVLEVRTGRPVVYRVLHPRRLLDCKSRSENNKSLS